MLQLHRDALAGLAQTALHTGDVAVAFNAITRYVSALRFHVSLVAPHF